ncbi:MAG TPA: hypothetical protein VF058_05545, partial [Actinomycetota bacterium]
NDGSLVAKAEKEVGMDVMLAETPTPLREGTWSPLLRAAGWAALATAALIPIQIAVFVAFPYPETTQGWFGLLQGNPLAGLVDLDLLLVVDNVLLVVIALALYVALRPARPGVMLAATGLWLTALVLLIASNPAIEMLSLSGRFAEATTETQRAATLGAGEAVLATWEGTAFQVSYVVGQLAGIAIGLVMLRAGSFGRAIPILMIAGNTIGFGYYLPVVGLAISAFSGVVLWAWYVLLGLRLLRMARSPGGFDEVAVRGRAGRVREGE